MVFTIEESLLARFDALRPTIKRRWAALLRDQPSPPSTVPGVITRDLLMLMLDESLARLSLNLRRRRPSARPATLAPFGALRTGCHCGLNLLLNYYLTGARTLRELLPPDHGTHRVAVIHRFNQLAHEEMSALCGVCQHRGGERCSLRPEDC